MRNNTMIIGTDVSLDECKAEGYMMAEYDGRKPFTKDRPIRFFNHYPDHCDEDDAGHLLVDTILTWEMLIEIYKDNKKGIDSCCETNKHINFDNPNYYDALHLASDIDAYLGLWQY